MAERITKISTQPSLNQSFAAAVCTIDAQSAGRDNAFVLTVVNGALFQADKTIQTFFDQFGNVNLIVPHPVAPQHLWINVAWPEFQAMFEALRAAAEFKSHP